MRYSLSGNEAWVSHCIQTHLQSVTLLELLGVAGPLAKVEAIWKPEIEASQELTRFRGGNKKWAIRCPSIDVRSPPSWFRVTHVSPIASMPDWVLELGLSIYHPWRCHDVPVLDVRGKGGGVLEAFGNGRDQRNFSKTSTCRIRGKPLKGRIWTQYISYWFTPFVTFGFSQRMPLISHLPSASANRQGFSPLSPNQNAKSDPLLV